MIEQHVFILNSLAFPKIMRGFFGPIIKFLYYSIAKLVDFMYDLADGNLGLNSQIVDEFSDKFFLILIIFMIFKLTFSLINYLVDPAAFSDNKKGFSNIIKRIIISVALLVSINPIFSLLGDIQNTIISEDIISNYILYTSNDNVSYYQIGDKKYYATKMDPNCDEQRYIFSNSIGDRFSVLALRPFYQLTPLEEVDDVTEQKEFIEESDYCGASVDVFGQLSTSEEMAIQKINATLKNTKTSASELLTASIYNGMSGDWDPTHDETFYVNFNYFWALIVGIVVCLFIITICFDVVIRALSLFFYQIIAPLPIIMYVSPNGKESEMLSKWFKSTVSVWVSLFIKIAALSLGLYFCGLLCDSLNNDSYGLIKQIVVIIGTLMFAKKFPKLLEELIPGLKLGGMELNPFKRISKDALGGNMLLGAGAGLAAAGLSGVTNGVQRGIEGISDLRKNGLSAGRVLGHVGRTLGSGIAGATRGGINAFGRTSKDGKLFSGAWNGYQTAMYSKLIREENRRKGATMLGTLKADFNRMTGTLTDGQREQIDAERMDQNIEQRELEISQRRSALDIRKRELAQEKYDALKPIQTYNGLAKVINDLVDKDSKIETLTAQIGAAREAGNQREVERLTKIRDTRRRAVSAAILDENSDYANAEAIDALRRMQDLAANNAILQQLGPVIDNKGSFNRKVEKASSTQVNVISRTFDDRELVFENDERAIQQLQQEVSNIKNSQAYRNAHDKDSPSKVENSIQMNNEGQKPGHMFSAGRPAQQTISDSSYTSNIGGGN